MLTPKQWWRRTTRQIHEVKKFNCNLEQNNSRIFHVLAQFFFTSSETRKLTTSCLTSYRTNEDLRSLPSRPPKKQVLTIVLKNSETLAVKNFTGTPILLNFVNVFNSILSEIVRRNIFFFTNAAQTLWNLHYLEILVFQKTQSLLKWRYVAIELWQWPNDLTLMYLKKHYFGL